MAAAYMYAHIHIHVARQAYVHKTLAIFPQQPTCQELLRRMTYGKCNLQAVATSTP